jgi:hypothetical protein
LKRGGDLERLSLGGEVVQLPENRAVGNESFEERSSGSVATKYEH